MSRMRFLRPLWDAPARRGRYNTVMRGRNPRGLLALIAIAGVLVQISIPAAAQTPQPFPRPASRPPPPEPSAPPAVPPAAAVPPADVPTEAQLGFPVYPTADFLRSYDAGLGQRYYVFGTNTGFTDLVAYYRTVLKTRGAIVLDAPAIHTFEVGRFREETMAFPPGVTIKDYTWNGSEGYLHVAPGATRGVRYKVLIQIVPAPATAK
jgi:hypothetical protein